MHNPSLLKVMRCEMNPVWQLVRMQGIKAKPQGLVVYARAMPLRRYSRMSNLMPNATPPDIAMPEHSAITPEQGTDEFARNVLLLRALSELAAAPRGSARADAAFTAVYDASIDRVHSVVRRFVRDEHHAQEVVEDVYCQAWRDASMHDESRGPVMAWLLVMARSRALDFLRKQRSTPLDFVENIEDNAQALLADDPFDMVASSAEQGVVRDVLSELRGPARQMVSLAFMRGLTHQEIADVLRLPLGTVKTTIRRALLQMRSAIEARAPEVAQQFGMAALGAVLTSQNIQEVDQHESA
jgi:RNA polymerase sigma factor (sigma-70 family)